MLFFFVLSGVVLTRALLTTSPSLTPFTFLVYAAQRATRLCLPAAASVVLSIGLYEAFFNGTEQWPVGWLRELAWKQPPSMPMLASDTLLVGLDGDFDYNTVLWSLMHELRISIFIPVLVAIPLFRRPIGWFCLAALGFIGPLALVLTVGPFYERFLGSSTAEAMFLSIYFSGAFALGATYAFADPARRFPGTPLRKTAVAVAILALLCSTYDATDVLLSLAILWLAQQQGVFSRMLRTKLLVLTGRSSFSLYLAHVPIILAATQYAGSGIGGLFVCAVLIPPATLLLFHVAEQPAQQVARRIGQAARRSRFQPARRSSTA